MENGSYVPTAGNISLLFPFVILIKLFVASPPNVELCKCPFPPRRRSSNDDEIEVLSKCRPCNR
jgi:hypothetical protein